MNQLTDSSQEISAKLYAGKSASQRLRPIHTPFWIDQRTISKFGAPPYTFYDDPVRGTLLHARRFRTQAWPMNRWEGPALVPEKCNGIWFIPTPELSRRLKAVEADMIDPFFKKHESTPTSKEDMSVAVYLRQVFDHFLYKLCKQVGRSIATAGGHNLGSFEAPIELESVEEQHMKNALENSAAGRSYRVGALTIPSVSEAPVPNATPATKGAMIDKPVTGKRSRPLEPEVLEPTPSAINEASGATSSNCDLVDEHQPYETKKRRLLAPVAFITREEANSVAQEELYRNRRKAPGLTPAQATAMAVTASSSYAAQAIAPPILVPDEDSSSSSNEDSEDEWQVVVFVNGSPLRLADSTELDPAQSGSYFVKDAFISGLLSQRE